MGEYSNIKLSDTVPSVVQAIGAKSPMHQISAPPAGAVMVILGSVILKTSDKAMVVTLSRSFILITQVSLIASGTDVTSYSPSLTWLVASSVQGPPAPAVEYDISRLFDMSPPLSVQVIVLVAPRGHSSSSTGAVIVISGAGNMVKFPFEVSLTVVLELSITLTLTLLERSSGMVQVKLPVSPELGALVETSFTSLTNISLEYWIVTEDPTLPMLSQVISSSSPTVQSSAPLGAVTLTRGSTMANDARVV